MAPREDRATSTIDRSTAEFCQQTEAKELQTDRQPEPTDSACEKEGKKRRERLHLVACISCKGRRASIFGHSDPIPSEKANESEMKRGREREQTRAQNRSDGQNCTHARKGTV